MVWLPCASEGVVGDVTPSWQRRDSAGTGGASASGALCGACGENQKTYRLGVQQSLSNRRACVPEKHSGWQAKGLTVNQELRETLIALH
jgi:hypothetical protein